MNNTARQMTKPTYLFLIGAALVFIAGIIFRFSNLDFASLWSDELYSVAAALDAGTGGYWLDFKSKVIQELTYHDSFITWKAADNTPPLFESILILWAKIFGKSDFALRALPATLGSLVPILFYFGSYRAIGKSAALFGSAFLALSPTLIEYSQEVRAYMLACLLSTIAVTKLVSAILSYQCEQKATTNAEPWCFVIILTVLSYSHYTGFFTAGMLAAIYLLFISLPQKRYSDIAKFLIVPALIAPWMALSWKAFRFSSKGGYGWRDYHISDIFSFMIPNTLDFYVPNIAIYASIFIIFTVVVSLVKVKPFKVQASMEIKLSLALIVVICFLFLYTVYNSFTSKMWHPRYFVVSTPLVAMIFSLLTSRKEVNKLVSYIVIMPCIAGLLYFVQKDISTATNPTQKPLKGDYRDAAKFLANNLDDSSGIVLGGKQNAAFYLHYLYLFSGKIDKTPLFDVSFTEDINNACTKINGKFKKVFLIRHVSYISIKNDLSSCLHMSHVETRDFLDISVDSYNIDN